MSDVARVAAPVTQCSDAGTSSGAILVGRPDLENRPRPSRKRLGLPIGEGKSGTSPNRRYAMPAMHDATETVAPLWDTGPEEDAFFHAARIDTVSVLDLSDLDRRTDPTVHIRRYETRRSWIVTGLVALMAPLLLLAVVIGIGRLAAESSATARSPRIRAVEDMRTELSLATVTRAPLAMQPAVEPRAPRRGARSHRFGR